MAHVKVCPVCGAENAPAAQRCESCSAMLMGVDLTEKGEGAPTVTDAPAPAAAAPAALQRCPHPDCGQLNAPQAGRCVYCDRPLEQPAAAAPALRAAIRWPWTEEAVIEGCLVIGREPPAPAPLAARLSREYANVSRRHAELRVSEGALWIVDLGSANGTFVNDTRIAPNQPVRLVNGATLRFAASLVAQVSIAGEA